MFENFPNSVNIIIFIACAVLIYYLFFRNSVVSNVKSLEKLKMRDFTVSELAQFDGIQTPYRLIAVNGKVFDVSESGHSLYGFGAPYSNFAGKDASRALSTFCNDPGVFRSDYDYLTDLDADEMGRLKEWELQFTGTPVVI